MKTKIIVFVMLMALMCSGAAQAQTILIVSDCDLPAVNGGDERDDELVQWLIDLGFTVDTDGMNDNYRDDTRSPWDPANGAKLARLQAADLIIVSRRTGSGDYDGDRQDWNELTTPLILCSGYLTRGGGDNRWGWTHGGSGDATRAETDMIVETGQESHPFLSGITLGGSNDVTLFDWAPGTQSPKGVYLPNTSGSDFPANTVVSTFAGRDMLADIPSGTDLDALPGQSNGPYGVTGERRVFFGHWGYDDDFVDPYPVRQMNWDDLLTANYKAVLKNMATRKSA